MQPIRAVQQNLHHTLIQTSDIYLYTTDTSSMLVIMLVVMDLMVGRYWCLPASLK